MSAATYKAVLFAPDGEWTTDYSGSESIEDVENLLADQGSRWYFYPFHGVIRDNGSLTRASQRLVSAAYPFEDMKGRSVKTFGRMLAETPENELEAILNS
jgi:hypothetical protein